MILAVTEAIRFSLTVIVDVLVEVSKDSLCRLTVCRLENFVARVCEGYRPKRVDAGWPPQALTLAGSGRIVVCSHGVLT